jgi:hypothetical protein
MMGSHIDQGPDGEQASKQTNALPEIQTHPSLDKVLLYEG